PRCKRAAPLAERACADPAAPRDRSPQTPVAHALPREERLGVAAVEQRERREHAGLRARIGRDRDGARRILYGPTRARVEDVPVALAGLLEIAARVAARGEPAARELDAQCRH